MIGGYEHPALSLAKRLVNPLVIFISLVIAVEVAAPPFNGMHLLLGVLAFFIGAEVFDEFKFFDVTGANQTIIHHHFFNLILAWLIVVA